MAKKTGRPPKPAAISTGNESNEFKETQARIEQNLQTKATLRAPTQLSAEAKKEWRRVMKLYKEMDADILSNLDEMTLIIYCEAVAIYKKAQELWINYQAVVTTDPRSQTIIDKTFKTMEKQSQIIAKCASDLCLTPVGRARMGINPADKKIDDPLELMFQKYEE